MFRKALAALALGTFLTFMPGLLDLQAEAAYFAPLGKSIPLYFQKNTLNMNAEGERVSFVRQQDGVLRMYSRDGNKDYLSFMGYYDNKRGVDYSIRKIELKDPDKVLLEINASQGAHAKNAGYWIVGKYKGKWVTFISLDTLASYGYTVGEWHQISTEVDNWGRLILNSRHEYLPAGAQYEYQRRYALDFSANLFWDEGAQWFGIKRIR